MEGLSDILGQPAAINLLQRAVLWKQPHHAYLFHGPESAGKGTTAKAFARALLCQAPRPDGDGCGECGSCQRLESGNHPDFRLIGIPQEGGEGARWEISIDQIRQNPSKPRVSPPPLGADAYFQPLLGERKVYVIDPADLLSPPAGGALLKLLEEPPSYVVIILVTARPAMVLSTLRSRCWPVRFGLVASGPAEQALLARGCPPERARLFAALAEGKIGWAITNWQKEEIDTARRQVIELFCRLPEMPASQALRFAEELREIAENLPAESPVEEAEQEAGETSAPKAHLVDRAAGSERALRAALPAALDLAICWLRDVLLTASGAEDLIANEDFRDLLVQGAGGARPEQARACILSLLETKRLLQRYANPILATEALALRLQRALR